MARYLACIIYRLFTKGQAWVDRGAENFERNRETRDLARLVAQHRFGVTEIIDFQLGLPGRFTKCRRD